MKKRIISGFTAFILCALFFITPLSMPVYAAESGRGGSFGGLWDSFVNDSGNDRFGAYLSNQNVELTRQGSFGAERGGSFGTPKRFYTGSSQGKQEYTPTKVSIRYESGETTYSPIISSTYSYSSPDNYHYTYTYNDFITNNSYDITEIYYSEEYDFYKIITNNDYEYYLSYSPTYISVVSYDGYDNYSCYNSYYFQLPDGRNSYDLTADDVWGTYFLYPDMLINYDKVAEDDGYTEYLYHFDGNMNNSSAVNIDVKPTYTTLNYDTGRFGQAFVMNVVDNTYKNLDWVTLDFDSVDFWVYFSSSWYTNANGGEMRSVCKPYFVCGSVEIPTDSWVHIALSRNDIDRTQVDCYVNGVFVKTTKIGQEYSPANSSYKGISNYEYSGYKYCTFVAIDEMRYVKGVDLYTDDFTPSTQPYDTNKVFVLPDSGIQGNIAIKSDISVSDIRVGGVRPTIPVNGYVYVYTENNIVGDVQQYQNDGWYSVDAVIYDNEQWNTLQNYNLSNYTLENDSNDDVPPDNDDSSGGNSGGSSNDDTDNDTDFSILGKLVKLITGFIGELFDSVLGAILDLVNILIDNLRGLLDSFTGITGLIGSLFGFFPSEMISVLTIGLTAIFVLAIIKMFKG